MSYRIRCYTLFDITKTGVLNRKAPSTYSADELKVWEHRRNTQANYDTILQVISLRSQPEENTDTTEKIINFKEFSNFGFLFDDEEDKKCWHFDFTILHTKVFYDGIDELGSLLGDANGVPIVKTDTTWSKLPNFLDTSPELRNIYFEILRDE
jgi:hypothetical protein